jgi:hypothetical protein
MTQPDRCMQAPARLGGACMPPAVNQSNVKHHRHAKSPTEYKEFEGRSHYSVIGSEGWEELLCAPLPRD